jgi:hypothetical protein
MKISDLKHGDRFLYNNIIWWYYYSDSYGYYCASQAKNIDGIYSLYDEGSKRFSSDIEVEKGTMLIDFIKD